MQADLGVLVQDSCEVIGSWVCLLGPWSIEGLWASKRVSEWQGHLELSWTAEIVFNIFLILLDMVGSKTDEIGDEPQIGATQVFPQKCQNKDRGHSLKLQTVVGCSVDCLRVMGEMIMFMQCLCILFEITFHLHSNGTFAEYYGQKRVLKKSYM